MINPPPDTTTAKLIQPRTHWSSLLIAISIMLGVTVWPGALAPNGSADHWAAVALFWSMSAGFVSGVGFQPHFIVWRRLFSPAACWLGLILTGLRLLYLL